MIDCKRLVALRKKSKMKQFEVANVIGIERTTYCRYENGQITPPIEMVIALADCFGVATDYLLGKVDIPNPEKPPPTPFKASVNESLQILKEEGVVEDIEELIEVLLMLKKDERNFVLDSLHTIAEIAQGKLPLTRKEAMKRESKSDE